MCSFFCHLFIPRFHQVFYLFSFNRFPSLSKIVVLFSNDTLSLLGHRFASFSKLYPRLSTLFPLVSKGCYLSTPEWFRLFLCILAGFVNRILCHPFQPFYFFVKIGFIPFVLNDSVLIVLLFCLQSCFQCRDCSLVFENWKTRQFQKPIQKCYPFLHGSGNIVFSALLSAKSR